MAEVSLHALVESPAAAAGVDQHAERVAALHDRRELAALPPALRSHGSWLRGLTRNHHDCP